MSNRARIADCPLFHPPLSGDIDTTRVFVEAIVEDKQSADTVHDLNSTYGDRAVNAVYEFIP
jgi:hypothetical protein